MDFIRTVLAGWYRLVQNAEPPPTCSAGAPKRVELKDHASALASLVFCFAVVFAFVAVGEPKPAVWRIRGAVGLSLRVSLANGRAGSTDLVLGCFAVTPLHRCCSWPVRPPWCRNMTVLSSPFSFPLVSHPPRLVPPAAAAARPFPGWLLVWRVALRHIKFFREVLGINKDKEKKAAARKQAAEEIERLRRSVGRLSSAAPTAPNAAAGAGSAACVAPR